MVPNHSIFTDSSVVDGADILTVKGAKNPVQQNNFDVASVSTMHNK